MAGKKKDQITEASAVELDESALDTAQGGAASVGISAQKVQKLNIAAPTLKIRGDGSV